MNLKEWASAVILHVKDLALNGCKVLLIYDTYGSYVSLEVLQLFDGNGIVVYALPSHISGTTQTSDMVSFTIQ